MEIKSLSATVVFIVAMTILGPSVIGVGEMAGNQDDNDSGWLRKLIKNDNWHKKFWDLFDFNKFKGFLNSQGSESSSNNFDVNDGGDDNPPPPPPSCPQDPTVTTMLANGDVKVTYTQSLNLNDNSYGVNLVGWGTKDHTFNALKNSDNLQVKFKKSNGDVVLDFYLDYLSVKSGTNSGYDSLGPLGGDGSMVSGSSSNIMSWSTSLADNLNNLGFFAGGTQVVGLPPTDLLIDSPPTISSTRYTLPFVSPFTGWNFVNSYTVTIKAAAFPGGFVAGGYSVSFPSVHNSPPKKCPVDEMFEHAFIDLGLSKVLVDPNGVADTGDEYFDNLITECSFHSDKSINGKVCLACFLVDKKIEPCEDLFLGLTEFVHGTILNTQIDGVTVTAEAFGGRPNNVIIFEGNTPGGSTDTASQPDPDLRADGICPGCAGLYIAVIPENINDGGDEIVDIPNDSAAGGIQTWVFDKEWYVRSFDFVDYDNANENGKARAYNNPACTGTPVATADIKKSPNGGDGSVQTILLNANNVRCLEFEYKDSGGVTNIKLECIKKFDEGSVLSEGKLELPDGYVASTQLSIPLDPGVDIQKAVGIKINTQCEQTQNCVCERPDTFTVRYNGPTMSKVVISGTQGSFTINGPITDGFEIVATGAQLGTPNGKMPPNTTYDFYKDNNKKGTITIHTSCSQTLFVGQMFTVQTSIGEIKLTVVSGTLNGIPSIPDASCPNIPKVIFSTSFEDTAEKSNWNFDSSRSGVASDGPQKLEILTTDSGDPANAHTGTKYLGGSGNFDPEFAAYNRSIDVSAYHSVQISLWYSNEDTETEDDYALYYKDGSNWIPIKVVPSSELNSSNGQTSWKNVITSIPDSVDTLVIQFRWSSSSDSEHMMLDDMEITGIQN